MPDVSPLTVTLFGQPKLAWQGAAVDAPSRKGQALLIAIAVKQEPMRRAELAELLWGVGRVQNVRQELTGLRALPGADEWLLPDDPVDLHVRSDLAAFEAACAAGDHAAAIELYTGPLLDRYELAGADAFNDWLEVERQRIGDRLRVALRSRAIELDRESQVEGALQHVKRLLQLDPLDESAHRDAMRLSLSLGDLAAALAQYSECRRVLLDELGVEPLPETEALLERVQEAVEAERKLAEQVARRAADAVAELGGDALRLARLLALTAPPLPLPVLARALELAERDTSDLLEEIRRASVLAEHELVPAAKRALVASTPVQVKRYLHGRVAEALAHHDADPGEVAAQYLRAHETDEAAEWFGRAAAAAAERYQFTAAVTYLHRALWATEERGPRCQLLLRLESAATQAGDAGLRAAALDRLEEETFLLQDDLLLLEAKLVRGAQLVATGDITGARDVAAEAVATAERLGRTDRGAAALHLLAVASFHLGDLRAAHDAFLKVAENDDPSVRLPALNNLGSLAGIRGDLTEAKRFHDLALGVARSLGDKRHIAAILNNLGATQERLADYAGAADSFEQAARFAAALQDPGGEATAWVNVADVALKQSKTAEAAEALKLAARLEAPLALPALTLKLLLRQGMLKRYEGDTKSAVRLLERALQVAAALKDERREAIVRFNLEMTRLMARADATPNGDRLDDSAAKDALAELERLEIYDVLPWAYAEMGTVEGDPAVVREWADRLGQHDENPYLKLKRLELLARANSLGGGEDEPEGLSELRESLGAGAP